VISPKVDDATPVNVSPSGKNFVLSDVLPIDICGDVGTSIESFSPLTQTNTSG